MKYQKLDAGLTTLSRIGFLQADEDSDEEQTDPELLVGTFAIDSEGRVWKEVPSLTALFRILAPPAEHPEDRRGG